ncbi:unnamed protein product [Cylicocyclus nassatus]|uniref:Uncharacterized protein n=1 Tax=Cylicocyclus nassatus TaxID=53992 RepID=A0AA36DTK4_CYLNA|nr:unnamed protein product [Cylicocyclus nassatus]
MLVTILQMCHKTMIYFFRMEIKVLTNKWFVVFIFALSLLSFPSLNEWRNYFQENWPFVYDANTEWIVTCALVGFFMCVVSPQQRDNSIWKGIFRLELATLLYFSLEALSRLSKWTARCDLNIEYSRMQCEKKGGRWSGLDIFGHTFTLIYSILLIAKEVVQFDDDTRIRGRQEQRRCAQCLVGWIVLNIWWGFHLFNSFCCHSLLDKVAGASAAVLCGNLLPYLYTFAQNVFLCIFGAD